MALLTTNKMNEQEIEKLAEEKYPKVEGYSISYSNAIVELERIAFIAGAKSQSMSEWVSVETPPSNRTYVLTFSKYNGMDICEYKHGCFFIGLERQTTVSMWQPLPPPPQTSK